MEHLANCHGEWNAPHRLGIITTVNRYLGKIKFGGKNETDLD